MNDHQHAAIELARIAWHDHQFEHECYGLDCDEDRRLYRAYLQAINGDPAESGTRPCRRPGRALPDEEPRPVASDSQRRGRSPQLPLQPVRRH